MLEVFSFSLCSLFWTRFHIFPLYSISEGFGKLLVNASFILPKINNYKNDFFRDGELWWFSYDQPITFIYLPPLVFRRSQTRGGGVNERYVLIAIPIFHLHPLAREIIENHKPIFSHLWFLCSREPCRAVPTLPKLQDPINHVCAIPVFDAAEKYFAIESERIKH